MSRHKPDDKLILVKHRPGVRRKTRLFFVTALVVVAALGFSLGQYLSGSTQARAVASLDRLSLDYEALKTQEQALRQEVANLESGRAIDEVAKLQIQGTISDLKGSVSQLQKDVSFYKNIMAPSDNAKGLQVQKVEIKAEQGNSRYAYKIVLAQVADNKTYVNGVVAVNLIGMQAGKKEVLPLRDISELKELGIKFRFRYFQDITGEFLLPEGFKPDGLQVVAQTKGKKASRLERSFDWRDLLNVRG